MALQSNFTNEFQDLILGSLLQHPEHFAKHDRVLQASQFSGTHATIVAECVLTYRDKYGRIPGWETLIELCENGARRLEIADDDAPNKMREYLLRLKEMDTADVDYVLDRVVPFAREREVISAVRKVVENIKDNKPVDYDIVKMFEDALAVGQNLDDMGYVLHAHADAIIDKVMARDYGIPTGYPLLDRVWKTGWAPGWLVVPVAPPKRYKCLDPETPVIMYDGTTQPVKNVKPGDLLMGDDSTPRRVLQAGYGHGPMYRVTQQNGDAYVCNDAHILCLKSENGKEDLEISAEEFCQLAKTAPSMAQRYWQGFKTGIELPEVDVPLEPYFLGLWLGDGSSHNQEIAVGDKDPEIETYLIDYASRLGLRTSKTRGQGCVGLRITNTQGKPNRVRDALRALNVITNKHIPTPYLLTSRRARLQLLAGLIDSDGSAVQKLGLKFVNTNKTLIDNVCWLARSLGFKAKITTFKTGIRALGYAGKAHAVIIAGNLPAIPVKVPRKKMEATKKHKVLNCKLKVKPIGHGRYYGFTLDGNHRFLLGDFTVTHNTAFCINLALNMVGPAIGHDVLYYSCEISQELAAIRAMTNITGKNFDYLWGNPEKFKAAVRSSMTQTIAANLLFKDFAAKSATISQIKAHAKMAIKQFGLKPRAIIIDYAETVKSAETKNIKDYQQQYDVYTDARAMGKELGCVVIMPDRCNRETVGLAVPNMTSFAGFFGKGGVVDVAIGLCASDAEFVQNVLRFFIFINRHGAAMQHFRGEVSPDVMQIRINEEIPYEPEEEGGRRRRHKDKDEDALPKELR